MRSRSVLTELVDALRAERAARDEVAIARQNVAAALRRQERAVELLRDEGHSYGWIALHASRAPGCASSRDTLAARFRKRASRVTSGHCFRAAVASVSGVDPLASEGRKEADMARVVRRKVTEEWVEEDGDEVLESTAEDEEEDDEEETEDGDDRHSPKRRLR